MTEIDKPTAELLDELLWLALHAQERVKLNSLTDYWYVLGQRNTYARAAAMTLAPHLEEDSAVIADRIVDAITVGTTDVTNLRAVALGGIPAPSHNGTLDWTTQKAFDARFGDVPGLDIDFGMRWGRNHDQRISLRRTPDATEGMLYAYDRTWDEYALLQRRVPVADVRTVFLEAAARDPHLPVEDFARLIEANRDIRARTIPPSLDAPAVEL